MAKQTSKNDPTYSLLVDHVTTIPVAGLHRENCYICTDWEYAQMGLPLCYACSECGGHVPADDYICENGHKFSE